MDLLSRLEKFEVSLFYLLYLAHATITVVFNSDNFLVKMYDNNTLMSDLVKEVK